MRSRKSGTNTLEGYFHPRQLSFAIAALAVVSFLRGRYGVMCALVAVAGALHPTTALWFAIWLSVATLVSEPRLRVPIAAGVAAAGVAGVWALLAGPLAGRLVRMDAVWLETLAAKDYLFPLRLARIGVAGQPRLRADHHLDLPAAARCGIGRPA